MKFLLLGEGPSDLHWEEIPGRRTIVKKGLMTMLLEKVWGWHSGEPIEGIPYTRPQLAAIRKKNKRHLGHRPDMVPKPHEATYQYAVILARESKLRYNGAPAVYFKDADRTNSKPGNVDEAMVAAMDAGFQAESFPNGIPMVPKPRQEAWLLAYYQKYLPNRSAYANSGRWENLSGNDHAPRKNNAKALLDEALKRGKIRDIRDDFESIDWHSVDMPSFCRFASRVQEVARRYGT
jgi:hypothetical protein